MTFETLYWTNRNDDAHPTELQVSAEHGAVLRVEANAEGSSPQSVGLFRSSPPASELARLWDIVSTAAFQSERNASDILPGEVVRRITVRIPGQPDVERIASEGGLDPRGFVDAERILVHLAELARAQPQYATAIALGTPAAALDRAGGTVSLSVNVRNVGTTPLALPGPVSWVAEKVTFTVFVLRSDLPTAQLRNEHQRILELEPEDVEVARPSGGGTRRERLYLEPGSSLQLHLSHRVGDLPRGKYDAWAEIALPIREADGSLVLRCLMRSTHVHLSGVLEP